MTYPTTEAGWWRSEFETTCELIRTERGKVARLTAVADAARTFHAKGPDFWDDGHGDPEWVALGAALDALEGEQR